MTAGPLLYHAVLAQVFELGNDIGMRIFLPNSANLQNITAILPHVDFENPDILDFSMNDRWVAVHPVVLALTAALAADVRSRNGIIRGRPEDIATLPYLIRMGLFRFLGLEPRKRINEHESAGRFIPLTQIRTNDDLKKMITELIPLLHAESEVARPIQYVFSELVRNVLEHSRSSVGAIVCAQYYYRSKRISIGIADMGVGVRGSMERFHPVGSTKEAILNALRPGVSGATSRIGGNEQNAGAGLFFTKSIATVSNNYFVVYSGDCLYRLMRTPKKIVPKIKANPLEDRYLVRSAPRLPGTVLGINFNIEEGVRFTDLLDAIREEYHIGVKVRKDYAQRIRFGRRK